MYNYNDDENTNLLEKELLIRVAHVIILTLKSHYVVLIFHLGREIKISLDAIGVGDVL